MLKRLKKLFGNYTIENVLIVPYRSYGTNSHLYVKGRVLDNHPLQVKEESFFKTLTFTYKQFDTFEIPDIEVELHLGDIRMQAATDSEGYFLFDVTLQQDIKQYSDAEGWMQYNLQAGTDTNEGYAAGRLLIPEDNAEYGIISDIDDTILHTGVTSFLKWRLLKNSLFINAYKRIPLKGAPQFYQKLHLGKTGKNKNPIFYISNSPWNLYEYLKLFLDNNKFPKGPVLLRNFNSLFQQATASEKPHKQKEIINILETYPQLKFILIGDSGEHDASIYTEIAAQFPDRILCIYLKSVKHKQRMVRVKSIVDNFRLTPVVLAETSQDAEIHARNEGYIL